MMSFKALQAASPFRRPLRAYNKATAEQDCRLIDIVVLIAQCAHTTCLHDKSRLAQRLPYPANCKRPQDVSVADDQYIAAVWLAVCVIFGLTDDRSVVFGPNFSNQPVYARNDLLGGLAARAAL